MASGSVNLGPTVSSGGGGGSVTAVTGSAPISSSGGTAPNISISQSGVATNGFLSSTDWNTFNNKSGPITTGNLTDAGTDGIVVTGGTGAVIGAGTSLAQHVADTTHNGYLSSVDWNTFNGKQAAGNYITALTGDGTASGPGSAALTFATVNGNVGSFGSASSVGTFTVNAKGLITAAASTSIQIAESQVTNLVSDLAGKQATGNYITALTSDVTASGPGSVASTIAVGAVTDTKGSLAVKPAVTVVATTNQALTGTPTIDGVATAAGSIILLSAQSTPSQNGPWVAAAGAWSRPTWYPSGGTTQSFQFITTLIRLGTVYQGSVWRQTAAAPITIDTTATTWVVTPKAFNTNTVVPGANGTHLTTIAGVVAWTTDPTPLAVSTITSNTSGVLGGIYLCNTSGGAFNLTLPTPVSGMFLVIKDRNGTFQTNNLSVLQNASEKIEGLAATKILQTNWGSYSFFSDGTDWYLGPF